MSAKVLAQEPETPEGLEEHPLDKQLLSIPALNWETLFYLSVVLLAGLLRFWDLGARAMHHDESLHALYSWYLYSGRGYQHNPLMHGPFQFHATSLVYFLLGASDYTARVLPAIFGTALVGLPYFLRGFLGRYGAMVAALLLALSPTMLYYSRFARNDIYIAVWTLLIVIAWWRYEQSSERKYLYLAAAALSLSFATKEVTYLTVTVFGSFLLLTTFKEVLPRVVSRFDLSDLSLRASMMVLVGTLSLPQGAALAGLLGALPFLDVPKDLGPSHPLAVASVAALGLVSAAIGLRWDKNEWVKMALVFYGIYILLYTTFFTNMPGFASGIWGSLQYWLEQHEVQRGGQPWYYYLLLLPIYEFLPLLFALAGGVFLTLKRDSFSVLLVFWLLGALVLYSYAGEKMPWLLVHQALPLILLAARFLGYLAEQASLRELREERNLGLLALLVTSPLWIAAAFNITSRALSGLPASGRWAAFLLVLCVVAYAAWPAFRGIGFGKAGRIAAAALLVILAAFTVRGSFLLNYYHRDTPVEMLIYTQTSPEAPAILKDIERLAMESGQGVELRITVDASEGFTWPWAWYLREYKNVDYPALSSMTAPPAGSVLLLDAGNLAAAQPYLDKYGEGRRYHHRWWFPENYRNLTWGGFLQSLVNPDSWRRKWEYFAFRKTDPLGSSDAMAFFPRSFQRPGQASAGAVSSQPQVAPLYPAAEMTIGGPGAMGSPKGLALDSGGNLHVADGLNHRVLKYDPRGTLVAQVGRRGTGDGEFQEPWGIAVDKEGNVYVADTWNHRIQKFDSNLGFRAKWGYFVAVQDRNASPGGFYGPRSIAVGPDNRLYITDTGNKRIQVFSSDGNFAQVFGGPGRGPGQFMEPVGIAFSATGDIYVADTWNRRVQTFRPDVTFIKEIPVPGWLGEGLANKPYLVVTANSDLLLTDPDRGRVLKYTRDGALSASIAGYNGNQSFKTPTGIAADSSGRIYVSDAALSAVVKLAP